jgi:hypothetical protein
MDIFVEMALGWLVVGSLVAVAVLMEHFRLAGRFPGKASWWLTLALTVGWPWPVWVWYATYTKTPRTARIRLATFVLIGALGLGWGCGLKLYDFLYPKKLEPPDIPALNAMIEGIISNPSTKNEQIQIGIPPRLFVFR